MLDVDHRNLISLTGSPGGKSIDEVPPPPMAPPLLWPSIDMVFSLKVFYKKKLDLI